MDQMSSPKQTPVQATRQVSEETLLKLAKEIAVKFIEVGRITPATFDESFSDIYATLKNSVDSK